VVGDAAAGEARDGGAQVLKLGARDARLGCAGQAHPGEVLGERILSGMNQSVEAIGSELISGIHLPVITDDESCRLTRHHSGERINDHISAGQMANACHLVGDVSPPALARRNVGGRCYGANLPGNRAPE
jgi:hypothetical protein